MYEKCGMRVKAAEVAVKIRDLVALERLRGAAGVGSVEEREIQKLAQDVKK